MQPFEIAGQACDLFLITVAQQHDMTRLRLAPVAELRPDRGNHDIRAGGWLRLGLYAIGSYRNHGSDPGRHQPAPIPASHISSPCANGDSAQSSRGTSEGKAEPRSKANMTNPTKKFVEP